MRIIQKSCFIYCFSRFVLYVIKKYVNLLVYISLLVITQKYSVSSAKVLDACLLDTWAMHRHITVKIFYLRVRLLNTAVLPYYSVTA